MTPQQLDALLTLGVRKGASDIHLEVGYPPMYRVNGALYAARLDALKPEDTATAAQTVLAGKAATDTEQDTSYSIAGISRFRASIFRQRNSAGLVMRVIPFDIPTLESLNLPAPVQQLADAREGLVLVTGATGQGKSTTIAALLQRLNTKERLHIVTIEDPIEFIFPVSQSLIIQREVGSDTTSFKHAIRSALRQDPDVIFVGELRDTETADTCLKAAETGHLIVATLHTMDAMRTVNRFLGLFPADEQALARGRMADVLKGVLTLRLLPRADGQGLLPACELMFTTMAIQQAIRDPARHAEIPGLIERGHEDLGSQSFDQHLQALVQSRRISMDTARAHATSITNLERALALESSGPSGPALETKSRR